jgi:phage terminase large subunit-like protein
MLEVTDPIALGFRGQLRKGAAVLVACRLTDGALFNLSGDDWETPENADDTWEVPQTGVDKRVREVLDTYNVKRLLCDPTNFQIMVGEWYADHEGVVEEYWTSSNTKMARAVEQFETAVKTGRIRWNDKQINQHVLNAHTKETTQGIVIRKDVKLSKRYITGAQAAILALEASVIAIMDGALNEADNELWTF